MKRVALGVWLAVLAALAACDRVFGTSPPSPDAPSCEKTAPEPDDLDADCVADAVDNCPTRANTDQRDVEELAAGTDADGIGDACDPNPSIAGDTLVEFEDFDDPATAMVGWREYETTGHFVFEPGGVLHDQMHGGSYLGRAQPVSNTPGLFVELGFRFDGWRDRTSFARIRAYLDDGPVPTRGLYCALDADMLAVREPLILGDNVGGATKSNIAILEGTHSIVIRVRRTPDLLECEVVVDGDATPLPPHPRASNVIWPAERGIGFTFSTVGARIDWVAIYSSTGPIDRRRNGKRDEVSASSRAR